MLLYTLKFVNKTSSKRMRSDMCIQPVIQTYRLIYPYLFTLILKFGPVSKLRCCLCEASLEERCCFCKPAINPFTPSASWRDDGRFNYGLTRSPRVRYFQTGESDLSRTAQTGSLCRTSRLALPVRRIFGFRGAGAQVAVTYAVKAFPLTPIVKAHCLCRFPEPLNIGEHAIPRFKDPLYSGDPAIHCLHVVLCSHVKYVNSNNTCPRSSVRQISSENPSPYRSIVPHIVLHVYSNVNGHSLMSIEV